jgi:hypothetical protein
MAVEQVVGHRPPPNGMVWRGFPGLPSAGRLKKTNLMFEIAFSNPAKVIQNTIPLRTFRQGPEHSAAAIFGSFQLLRNLPADGDSRHSVSERDSHIDNVVRINSEFVRLFQQATGVSRPT